MDEIKNVCQYVLGIDHVAIAVKDLEKAVQFYSKCFGFNITEQRTTNGKFSGMISATLERGSAKFVLVQGTSATSNVCQYICQYGPGVQHLALEVTDINKIYNDLSESGVNFISEVFKSPGLYQTFTYRDENSGMMIEIIQRNNSSESFSDENVQALFESMEREGIY